MFSWLQAAEPSSTPTQGATNSSPSVMRVAAGRGRFSGSTPQRLNDPWLRRMAALTTVALCGFMTPLAGASVASSASGPAGVAHAAQISGAAAQGAAARSSVSRPVARLASNDGQSKPVNLEGGDLSIFDAVATANGEVDLQLKDGATGTSHNPAQTTLKIPASTWQNISDDYPGSPGGYFVSQGTQANSPLQPASAAPKGRLGWDTSQLAQAGFSAAHFEVSYSGPEGASVALFGLDDNGQLASSLLVDGNYELNPLGSEIAPQQLAAAYPNWVFSAAGVYQLQVRVLAQRSDGTVIASPVRSYRVEVGDVAAQATPTPAPTLTPAPAPQNPDGQNPGAQNPGAQPSAAPSAVPSVAPSVAPQPVASPSASAQPTAQPSAQPGVSAAPSASATPVASPKPSAGKPATSPSPRSAIGGEVKAKPSAANPAGKQLLASSRSAKSAQAPRAAAQGRSASQVRAAVGQSRSAVTTRAATQSFVSQARPAQSFVAQARSASQGAAAQTSSQKAKAQSAAAVKENPASSAVSATATLTFVVGPGANGNANDGHFDLGPRIVDGKLKLQVKDDRSQPASWVDPATLTFSLGDKATLKAPDALNFVATPGQDVWMISSSQSAGVPWLGMNSQAEEIVSKTSGEVTFTLVSVEGPGKVSVFTSGGLGGGVGEHLLQEEGSSYTLPANTHAHQNWVFTAPGTYKLTISAQVTPKQGEQISGEDGGSSDGAAASSGAGSAAGSSEGGSASGAAGSASGSAKAGQAAGANGGKSLAKTGAVSGALNVAGGLMLLAVAVLVARRRMAWA